MTQRGRSILILVTATLVVAIFGVSAVAKSEWDVAFLGAVAVAVCVAVTWNYIRISRK